MLTNEFESSKELFTQISVAHSENKAEDPFYSEENLARLKKSIAQLERGEVVEKTLDELRKLVYG